MPLYIHRRTATDIGKISRADTNTYPMKFIAAWINKGKKPRAPQLTCNNNFVNSININKRLYVNGSPWLTIEIPG